MNRPLALCGACTAGSLNPVRRIYAPEREGTPGPLEDDHDAFYGDEHSQTRQHDGFAQPVWRTSRVPDSRITAGGISNSRAAVFFPLLPRLDSRS